jgi:hypothetical protein
MADTNFQTLQMLDPQYDAAAISKLQHQKLIGDLLLQQSQQENKGGMAGNVYVGPSWTQGLAKMLQMYTGNKMGTEADTGLMNAQAKSLARALSGGQTSPPADVTGVYNAPDGTQIGSTGTQSVPMPQNQGNSVSSGYPLAEAIKTGIYSSLGGEAAGSAYADRFKLTPEVKNWNAQGINPLTMAPYTVAAARKSGVIDLKPGETTLIPGNPNPVVAADFTNGTQGGYGPNGPTVAPIPGSTAIRQSNATAETLGKTLGTLQTGVDASGNPIYFMGVPPGTPGGPQQTQPQQPQQPQPDPTGVTSPGTWPPSSASQGGPTVAPQQSDRVSILNQEFQRETANLAAAQSKGDAEGVRIAQSNLAGIQREASATKVPLQGPQPAQVPPQVPPQAPQAPQGGIAPANAPGFNEFKAKIAGTTAELASKTLTFASTSPQRVNILDNILALSKDGVATGPGQDFQNKIKGYVANSPYLSAAFPKGWQNTVSDYQELVKFTKQNAQQAWQAAGGSGTDSQLEMQTEANVHTGMFPQALQGIAQWAKAGELAAQAKANLMQQSGALNSPDAYQKFDMSWRNAFDPRVFQLQVMDPTEQAAFVKKLTPTAAAEIATKRDAMRKLGAI